MHTGKNVDEKLFMHISVLEENDANCMTNLFPYMEIV